jgi:elongation factor P
MLSATQLRAGHIIIYKEDLCKVLSMVHYTPGNKRGFFRTKLRNLRTGATLEEKLMADQKFEQPYIETKEVEYSYADANSFVFMDPQTYEQIFIPKDTIGEDDQKWLKENVVVSLQLVDGEPLSVELPANVELKVAETEPQIKGATQSNSFKPATLENGVKITVPPFIQVGEVVRVDPREAKYIERA